MRLEYSFTLMGLAASSLLNQSQAACGPPVLLAPTQTVISEASPRFEWAPVPNASHYLVWLESRVPEGRVLLAEEFQTNATYMIPPRPLTNSKATIRLRVTAVCKDNSRAELSARFRIDENDGCRLQTPPVAQKVGRQEWSVHWQSLQSAQRYEIRVHAAEDGRPSFMRESASSPARVGPLEPGAWMFAVQPICKGLKGGSSWVAIENTPE